MLGDLNIGEPGALIGFAGPRVIEQTIRQKLPGIPAVGIFAEARDAGRGGAAQRDEAVYCAGAEFYGGSCQLSAISRQLSSWSFVVGRWQTQIRVWRKASDRPLLLLFELSRGRLLRARGKHFDLLQSPSDERLSKPAARLATLKLAAVRKAPLKPKPGLNGAPSKIVHRQRL